MGRLVLKQKHKLIVGDCLDRMKLLENESIHALISDPPAGIAFMGKDWDEDKGGGKEWIAWMTRVMEQAFRVLKPGAHGLVWAIPRTSHWTASALEDAGFEIRDVVTHVFGSGFPKSMNISLAIDKQVGAIGSRGQGFNVAGQDRQLNNNRELRSDHPDYVPPSASTPDAKKWSGWGTALKPASEHWVLVRKPCSEDTVAKNVLKHGVGGLNIDKSRIPANNQAWAQEKFLCDTCANHVERNVKLSTLATKESIAQENVGIRDLGKIPGILLDGTITADTGCSEETLEENTKSNLSMSMSGKKKTGRNQSDTLSTTSTKTKKIIGSKTCSSCGDQITSECMQGNAPATQGRFPSNFILSHNPDCLEMGTKKVKPSNGSGKVGTKAGINEVYGKYGALQDQSATTYVAEDGTETVAAFECTPGCAVAELDRQSGTLAPRGQYKKDKVVEGEFGTFEGKHNNRDNDLSYGDKGGASRFFYVAKASKKDKGSDNTHPTVKSLKLMSYLINMVTPPGGTLIDPFGGSGTTLVAAEINGFKSILFEQSLEYSDIILARAEKVTKTRAKLLNGSVDSEMTTEKKKVKKVLKKKKVKSDG